MIQPPFFIWQGDGVLRPCRGGEGARLLSVGNCAPHSLFSKRECAAPGGREKYFFLKHPFSTTGYDLPGLIQLR